MPFSRYTFLLLALVTGLTACTTRLGAADELATDSSTDSNDGSSSDSSTPSELDADTHESETGSGGSIDGLLPKAPTLQLSFSPVKQFDFSWTPGLGAEYHQLLESADGSGLHVQVGDDLLGLETSLTVPLHARENASYALRACNDFGCTDSETVEVEGMPLVAVGYFKASNTLSGDQFGTSVALSGDGRTLAVGAVYEGLPPGHESAEDTGAVYVFVRGDQGEWSQQAYIKAIVGEGMGMVGCSLALSDDGNTLVVGARAEDGPKPRWAAGGAHVFVRDDQGEWVQQAHLQASNLDAWDEFGYRVALSGDGNTLVVSAPFEDSGATGVDGDQADNSASNTGAVYVFVRDGQGEWSQQAYVKASNSDPEDWFGYSVALAENGSTLAVGARNEDSNAMGINGNQADDSSPGAGAVYLFVRDGQGEWSQQAYVKASNAGTNSRFGISVTLAGDGQVLAVGASGAEAAYVFMRDGQHEWMQQAYLQTAAPTIYDYFGVSVSLAKDGNSLAVGADGAEAVHVFVRDGQGQWSEQAHIQAKPNEGDQFGASVALAGDGETLAVGAPWEASNATGVGGDQTDNSLFRAGAVFLY